MRATQGAKLGLFSNAQPGLDETEPSDTIPLSENELWWTRHFQWLKDRGYLLRPRYTPDWVPSWRRTNKWKYSCEDSAIAMIPSRILDGTRLSDGVHVALKIVRRSQNPEEVDIAQFLTSEPLRSDPSNHCVPIYDTLLVPDDDDLVIMVMPLLRSYTSPAFNTVGEVLECFRQIFEGLQFMHKYRVAHRDCMRLNIMMDASNLYIDPFHPVNQLSKRDFSGYARFKTRTERPPRYYLIDFGLSRRYDSTVNALDLPVWGGDKQVPEFVEYDRPHNPFPTDVFYIGNAIKKDFLDVQVGLEFMQPLVADMIQTDPSKRPTMDEVVERFKTVSGGLNKWKLRSRVYDSDESMLKRLFRAALHWARQLEFTVRRLPALPPPLPR